MFSSHAKELNVCVTHNSYTEPLGSQVDKFSDSSVSQSEILPKDETINKTSPPLLSQYCASSWGKFYVAQFKIEEYLNSKSRHSLTSPVCSLKNKTWGQVEFLPPLGEKEWPASLPAESLKRASLPAESLERASLNVNMHSRSDVTST